MINGVSNNNNLNPGGLDADVWSNMSGEAQSLFIDPSLLESVVVRSQAISAEYGGFTGGVIDAKLKDARTDRWHFMAKYRYTKDDWAQFHLTDDQKNTDKSTDISYQPEFNKYEYAIAADGPISDHLGLMLSYSKQHSKIPLWSLYDINSSATTTYKEHRTQYRDNDNYLVKLNTRNIDNLEASLTAIYAPYTAAMYYPETRYNSDFDQKGGGLNIALDVKNTLNFATLKNTLAYKQDEFAADSDTNYYYLWIHTLGYANWDTSNGWGTREGNTGDQKFLESAIIYKGVLDFDEIKSGAFTHLIKTGAEAEFGKAQYKRDEAYYFCADIDGSWCGGGLNAGVTGSKEDGIIDGEQWAGTLYVYEPIDNKKSYTTAALFFEDSIGVDRFTIRPGVRVSTDTVTDNTDIAPRLYANADIFNDKVWNLYGGYNRYYGGLLLYNSIYEYGSYTRRRSAASAPWATVVIPGWGGDETYSLDGIETPYSDEFSVGSSLAKWDTLFKLDFVNREHKDQLKQAQKSAVTTGLWEYYNTNDGKSSYWGVTISAAKEYELGATRHFSELSITNSEAKTNMNGLRFSSADDPSYSRTHVTYDGALKKAEEMPSPDYNAPWVITYAHNMALSDFLRLGLNARYEKGVDGYKYIGDSVLKDSNGLTTKEYESKHFGDIFNVDLNLDYTLKYGENKLTLGVEVLNLLNRKNDASYSTSSSNIEGYAMDRQFYANVKYEY
jgi:hypothetical protein